VGILTIGQVARSLNRPQHKIRALADELVPPLERFGQKRVVPVERVGEIVRLLERPPKKRGPKPATEGASDVE